MKTVAIVQARMGSTRLPNKVMRPICGTPMIGLLLERLAKAKRIDQIVLATSKDLRNKPLAQYVRELGYAVYQGSEDDVLDRYYQAAQEAEADTVVRITGDCPLIDPMLIDRVIEFHVQGAYDFVSNAIEPTFPDGLDAAVFRFSLLEQAWLDAKFPSEREHVTLYMRRFPDRYKIGVYKGAPDRSHFRWTVDEPADFEFVSKIYERLYPGKPDFGSDDIYRLLEREPELSKINSGISRNEGLQCALQQDTEWKARNENPNT